MKKKVKVSVIVSSSIIALIVVASLIMSFVKVSPMKYLDGYERVAVMTSAQYEMAETEESKKALEKALKTTKFTLGHAMLEGKFSYAPKIVKVDGEVSYLSTDDLSNIAPTVDTKMLKFYYSSTKTIKVDGVKIKYDRMIVEITYGEGEVINVVCTPYLQKNIGNTSLQDTVDENGFIGSIYYQIPQFKLRMDTSALYDAIDTL